MKISLSVERTKSRSGLHARSASVVLISGGRAKVFAKPERPGKGTYAKGEAGSVSLDLAPGDMAVHVVLTLTPRKSVKGYIAVYDHQGSEVLRVKYSRFKLRLSRGDPSYSWVVEKALEALGLSKYVRRRNYGARGGAKGAAKGSSGAEGR